MSTTRAGEHGIGPVRNSLMTRRRTGADTVSHARLLIGGRGAYRMHMPQLKGAWTVADRDALPDDGNRYEVIDGELFVTPAPAWRHQDAAFRLHRLLDDYLNRERVGHAFEAPADVVFSPRRGVQPDV